MEKIFTNIYESNGWLSDNKNPNYKGGSGTGSLLENNKDTYVPFLRQFIADNNIKSVVDLGCGDFVCGAITYDDLDIKYTGYDTYKKVVDYISTCFAAPKYTFHHLDFYNKKEEIACADLCIIKDVLIHWSVDHITKFLDYLIASKKYKHILICNCSDQLVENHDIQVGGWRALTCDMLPLKKYNSRKMFKFMSNCMKEVFVIDL